MANEMLGACTPEPMVVSFTDPDQTPTPATTPVAASAMSMARPWQVGRYLIAHDYMGKKNVWVEIKNGKRVIHTVDPGSAALNLYLTCTKENPYVEVQVDHRDAGQQAHVVAVRPLVEESEAAE
ncbi:MAG: hypothetical protein ACHREM_22525 [Polyangiales bacterium]